MQRPRPVGPDSVVCQVIELASGRTVTQVRGCATRKKSAEAVARRNAILMLKKKLGRRVILEQYRFAYRHG